MRSGLQLAALCSFALAQQYFAPLSKSPEALLGGGATGTNIVTFALIVLLVPPALLLLAEAIAGLISVRLRDGLHLAFIGALVALFVWQRLNDVSTELSARIIVSVSLLAGVLAAAVYSRFAAVRTYLTVLSFAPLLFLALFLVFSSVRTLVFGGDGERPRPLPSSGAPVVMLVLDELPVVSLMDQHQRIDAVRYPAFGQLASDATWYRNATSVGDYTQIAVPSILTGLVAPPDSLPVAADHPRSLFTLLGGSYRMDVSEAVTDLCGKPACPVRVEPDSVDRVRGLLSNAVNLIPALPSWARGRIARRLAPPWREGREGKRVFRRSVHRQLFDRAGTGRFLDALRPRRGHTLNFLHMLSPHRPWKALPSGQRYPTLRPYFAGAWYGRWPRDPWIATVAYQRHLLQLGAVDRVLGRLLGRLRALRLYDRSLIVVTADHGASFRPGDESRTVSMSNVADVASVPLFVKLPGERRGRIDDAYVETTDVLPTIAHALRMRVPWKTHGRPASEVRDADRSTLTIYRGERGGKVVAPHRELVRRRDATLRRQLALFGTGRSGPGLYLIGPHPRLVGRPVDRLARAARGPTSATVDLPSLYRSVNVRAGYVPANVTGEVRGSPARKRAIAVALNGRVAATAWTIARPGAREYYTAMVPTSALRRGANRVEVFGIEERGARIMLRPLT